MTLSQEFGRFVASLESPAIPDAIKVNARSALLNGLGIAMGSLRTPFAERGASVALAMDGAQPGGATLLANGRKSSVAGAAFANAALLHGRAQEDTCGSSHLGTVVIPILVALLETGAMRSDDFIPALVAGYEIGGRMDRALAGYSTPRGVRGSALYGCLAGAAAAARALRLDEAQAAAAIGHASAYIGGTLQSLAEGAEEWRYQVAMAARTSLAGAFLARAGAPAAPHALEGGAGLIKAYAGVDIDPSALLADLGSEWMLPQNKFKPFPICVFNQMTARTALKLHAMAAGRPVRRFSIGMTPYEADYVGMRSGGPFSSISQTLMSGRFVAATALLRGQVTLDLLTRFDDAEVNGLVDRSSISSDPAFPQLTADIRVELEDGTTLSHREQAVPADFALSYPDLRVMIDNVAGELGIGTTVVDRLDDWIQALPDASPAGLLAIFDDARAAAGIISA